MNNHFQIDLKNVTKNFEGLDVPVLKNLSFNINASEKHAIDIIPTFMQMKLLALPSRLVTPIQSLRIQTMNA